MDVDIESRQGRRSTPVVPITSTNVQWRANIVSTPTTPTAFTAVPTRTEMILAKQSKQIRALY